MSKKIYLSGGHSTDLREDCGAVAIHSNGTKYIEGYEAYKLAKDIFTQIKYKGNVLLDKEDTVLKETLAGFFRTLGANDVAIEFHFNAFNKKATGVEVVIPDNPSVYEKDLSKKLVDCIHQTLGIANRGVKYEGATARKKLGWMRPNCENILIEVCFIDNEDDMYRYHKMYDSLVMNIAKVLEQIK